MAIPIEQLEEIDLLCKVCGFQKESKFCERCNSDTPTHFEKMLIEKLELKDYLRNLFRSGEKIGSKAKKEIKQYVGNKDKNVISEIELLRLTNQKTRVIHRLWRRFGDAFRNVHEHDK